MYEPFLERDAAGIRAGIADFRRSHTSDDLFIAVARFAVLAFAPSQHSRHALIACAAAHDVRDLCGDRWDEILTECAIYAAASRQPWSEPPIFEPPRVPNDHPSSLDELRAAIASRDPLRGSRWLAARLADPALERDLFTIAAEDFHDFGHDLIVAVAAVNLTRLLGKPGRYVVFRALIEQLCAGRDTEPEARPVDRGAAPSGLARSLVDRAVAERGSIEAMHRIFLYDAGMQSHLEQRVAAHLIAELNQNDTTGGSAVDLPPIAPSIATMPEPYALARDYAAWLQSFGVARRLGDPRIVAAAKANLDSGESFADWSFA